RIDRIRARTRSVPRRPERFVITDCPSPLLPRTARDRALAALEHPPLVGVALALEGERAMLPVPACGARTLRAPGRAVFLAFAFHEPAVFGTDCAATDLVATGFEQAHDRDPDRVGPARLDDLRDATMLAEERQPMGADRWLPRAALPDTGVIDGEER